MNSTLCKCGCGEETKLANKTSRLRGWIKGQPITFIHGHNCKREAHYRWGGDKISYVSFHKRVYALRGKPNHCEFCGTTDSPSGFEWANMTGNLANPMDYKSLCVLCHRRHDRSPEEKERVLKALFGDYAFDTERMRRCNTQRP